MEELDRDLQSVRRLTLKLLGRAEGPAQTDGYRAFVARHHEDRWQALHEKYPGLLHVLGTTVECWVDAVADLERRVREDFSALGGTRVESVSPGLSDPHRGQRMVLAVELDSGRKWVYKPRDLSLDAAFAALSECCNDLGAEPSLPVLRPLCRAGYGWVPFVEARPCEDAFGAPRYYQRAGGLLALLYLLQATDCHRENWIACGDTPFLVDVETLLDPRPSGEGGPSPGAELLEFLSSVAGTGLLPRWDFDLRTRSVLDVSALGCVDLPPSPEGLPRIRDANTDDMRIVHERVPALPAQNVPHLGGAPVDPDGHVDELCAGFASVYRLLLEHRATLVREGGLLHAFRGKTARHLLRNTRIYHRLLARSYEPDALRSEVGRRHVFEILRGAAAGADAPPHAQAIAMWEIEELENGDVPLLTRVTDRTELSSARGTVPGFFDQSGYEQALHIFRAFDEDDLAHQLAIVRGTFEARRAVTSGAASDASGEWDAVHPLRPMATNALLDEARRLGDELLSRARRRESGQLTWLGLGFVREAERLQLQPVGEALYEGKAGIGVFLAALHRCTGDVRYRDGALRALFSVRALAGDPAALRAMGPGGIAGFGSVVYALSTVGTLLADDSLLDEARLAARFFTPEALRDYADLDVMSGAAGALLALLSLHVRIGAPDVLPGARACGDHLIARQVGAGGGLRAWSTLGARPLTGFSHGAAGIGLALVRLGAVTGEQRYLEAAEDALAFERAHFSEGAGNWEDLRTSAESGPHAPAMVAWCHGAAGIGLSRLEWHGVMQHEQVLSEARTATHAALSCTRRDVDHLCCGNFGRLALATAGASPERAPEAALALAEVVGRARREGGYRLFPNLSRAAYNPGFFRGTAGIGYTLLRCARVASLPNVLCLE